MAIVEIGNSNIMLTGVKIFNNQCFLLAHITNKKLKFCLNTAVTDIQ